MRSGNHKVYVPESEIVEQFTDKPGPMVLTDIQVHEIMNELERQYSIKSRINKSELNRIKKRISQIQTWKEKAILTSWKRRSVRAVGQN